MLKMGKILSFNTVLSCISKLLLGYAVIREFHNLQRWLLPDVTKTEPAEQRAAWLETEPELAGESR